MAFDPFQINVSVLYPLKTAENLWFPRVFRGYKMKTLTSNGSTGLKLHNEIK